MKYSFILIADLRYNINNNIVYNDADNVVLTEDDLFYIEEDILVEDLSLILISSLVMKCGYDWPGQLAAIN